ncbi:MAG: hypothetical protein ABIJ97_03105 [Bacteroidota bacterium]
MKRLKEKIKKNKNTASNSENEMSQKQAKKYNKKIKKKAIEIVKGNIVGINQHISNLTMRYGTVRQHRLEIMKLYRKEKRNKRFCIMTLIIETVLFIALIVFIINRLY